MIKLELFRSFGYRDDKSMVDGTTLHSNTHILARLYKSINELIKNTFHFWEQIFSLKKGLVASFSKKKKMPISVELDLWSAPNRAIY